MIYFLSSPDQGTIKIGYVEDTENIKTRLKNRISAIQVGNSSILKLEGVAQGNYEEEQNIHQALNQHRVSGEWFYMNNAVMATVARLSSAELFAQVMEKSKTELSIEEKLAQNRQVDFREIARLYAASDCPALLKELIETKYDWINQAYEVLGEEGFSRLNWRKKALHDIAVLNSNNNHKEKVRNMLRLKVGLKYSSRDLKERCKDIPGFTKLEDYYILKSCKMVVKRKQCRGYVIQGVN